MKFDWKFFVTLIVAVAGVAVPVWLWKADLQARSLQLKIASQTALAPYVPKAVSGLDLTIDGNKLDQPYLTVLELSNDGSRPVAAAEFEDAIQVLLGEGPKVVRSQLTDVSPKDLQPTLVADTRKVSISPLLLNPNDMITFSVITAGGKPEFSVRARIAGVQSVAIVDRELKDNGTKRKVIRAVTGGVLLFMYVSCALALVRSNRFSVAKPTLALGAISSIFGAQQLLSPLLSQLEISSWQYSGLQLFLVSIAAYMAMIINRRREI